MTGCTDACHVRLRTLKWQQETWQPYTINEYQKVKHDMEIISKNVAGQFDSSGNACDLC
jgi:hypothetical protein